MASTALSNFAQRVGSMRDKGRNSSRNRGGDFSQLFTLEENRKRLNKEEVQKIQDIKTAFLKLGQPDVPESRIEYALRSRAAQGDVEEAIGMLLLYNDSVAGVLRPYRPDVKMLGAENREKTTCWLDALLFAMFARTDVFEAVLHQQYADEERRKLIDALRLWVNLLRSGKLITTDITQHVQTAIAECGWPDAAKLRQQDASEAFNFITDKLQLPLLTLKTDIYHQGKEDATDDHKFITERMLDVALPDVLPDGHALKLEVLLEDYFNNRVEVKRHLARGGAIEVGDATNATDAPAEKFASCHVEQLNFGASAREDGAIIAAATDDGSASSDNVPLLRPVAARIRATSIFSERRVALAPTKSEGKSEGALAKEAEAEAEASSNGGAPKKEVLMPAWQFLNLIPWYTANIPEGSAQGRSAFSDRNLMLGICIKRYGMAKDGSPFRRSTHVDIPLEMASPHFTTGDDIDGDGIETQNFKLVLVAFICHRGSSVEAGHYISFVQASIMNPNAPSDPSETPGISRRADGTCDAWLRFDDLAQERVATVDIGRALNEESPYMLFYRVQPIDDEPYDDTPPPYEESEAPGDVLAEKLRLLKHDDSRGSIELSDRPSIEVTRALNTSLPSSPESRGRPSGPGSRPTSILLPSDAASVKTNTTDLLQPTESGSVNSTRAASPNVSRQQTKSNRESRPIADDTAVKRFSVSMSKFRIPSIGKDKDKTAQAEILVHEIPSEALAGGSMPAVLEEEAPPKCKEKKKMFKRRDSISDKPGKTRKPDRDCSIM